MFNKIILVGNLTRDIELRYTQSGLAIAKVGIASNRKYKASSGEQKEEVLFVDVTFFGRSAEIANQYLKRGSKILVEGRLQLEQWNAQDGSKRSKHSVVVESMQMLDSKGDSNQGGGNYEKSSENSSNYSQNSNQSAQEPAAQKATPSYPEIDIDEDEIPF